MNQHMQQKLVLFDIDYTLFDTDAYRVKLYPQLAKKLGIIDENFFILAKKISDERKLTNKHFSPDKFLQELLLNSTTSVTIGELEQLFWNEELYSEVLDNESNNTLKELQRYGVQIGLLSTGDTKHQLAKVNTLLLYLGENHRHIFPNKLASLGDVLERYEEFQVYLVDDLPEVLAKAKSIDSKIITILRHVNKKFEVTPQVSNFSPDWTINEISEVIDIVAS